MHRCGLRTKGRALNVAATFAVFGTIMVGIVGHGCDHASAATLPDARAWEMVSPLNKNGGEINGIGGVVPTEGLPEGGVVQASEDGKAITYLSLLAFSGTGVGEPKGAPIASQYLSHRGDERWLTENITTAVNSGTYPPSGSGAPYKAFSSDLSTGIMLNGRAPVENPSQFGAFTGYVDYYLRDNISGQFVQQILTSQPSEEPAEFFIELLAVTPDLRHMVLSSTAALPPVTTPQAGSNLYEWSDGTLQPINILPGNTNISETAPGGALLGTGFNEGQTISSDGSQVVWSQPGTESLFVREKIGTEQAATVQVDASRGGSGPSGGGEFRTASADGSRIFFTDRNRLTPDSTAGGNGSHQDLYMFDVAGRQLSDLTVDGEPSGASMRGVLGASQDGSFVYFVASGSLPGTSASTGHDNLYLWHEGAVRFIAELSPSDNSLSGVRDPTVSYDWEPSSGIRTARVTPNGQNLLFMSDGRLTDFDNRDAVTGVPDEEVYLYNELSNHLTCISCNSNGVRPVGASGFPGGAPWRTQNERGAYQPRVLSTGGGRVFFDSIDALVPQDTNNAQDVYEWEQDHIGSCQREGGCVGLLSGTASTGGSSLVDASVNGDDVFFITRAPLVAQDTDQLRDLYDARVDGGFRSEPQSAPECLGESCRPPLTPSPAPSSIGSSIFFGAGNVALVPSASPSKKIVEKKRSKPHKRKKHVKHKVSRANTRHQTGRHTSGNARGERKS
jgi:hypothetical protein